MTLLDDFSDTVTYILVMIAIFFLRGGGSLEFWGGSFYLSNILDRTLGGRRVPSPLHNPCFPSMNREQ